jgi:hypothetical protein
MAGEALRGVCAASCCASTDLLSQPLANHPVPHPLPADEAQRGDDEP